MHSTRKLFGAVLIFTIVICACSANDVQDVVEEPTSVQEGRSFGHHFLKRISFALIPAAFTVGVITTLLAALTIVSMKGLGVGVILLVLAIGQIFSRLLPAAAPVAPITYAAPPAPAPYPIIYARKSHETLPLPLAADPVWLSEKDW